MLNERIAVISGFRSPMGKAGGALKSLSASDLGSKILQEVIINSGVDKKEIDEVIIGNVSQPVDSANIARVIALKAGIPEEVPSYTVHRNCASGMQAFTSAADRIKLKESQIIAVGGVESMSNIPLLYNDKMTEFFSKMFRAKNLGQKLSTLSTFRPSFLRPIIGVQKGLTDPISGLIMGCTAENIAREFSISREEQDEFALKSHKKAQEATENGNLAQEIIAIHNQNNKNGKMIEHDEGIRKDQKMQDLTKLKPYFEKKTGTVTVGNSSQITDGAAFAILMPEFRAKELNLEVLGYIREYSYAGLDPSVMGFGPVYATSKLLDKTSYKMSDFDLVEINEAFAAQAIGCLRAFSSDKFAKEKLGKDRALGEIDPNILNVSGGAIALGHPVGMTGARIIIHLLRELKRKNKNLGLASLCVGGGQGGSVIVEVD